MHKGTSANTTLTMPQTLPAWVIDRPDDVLGAMSFLLRHDCGAAYEQHHDQPNS
jgi:hypothetical protein